MNSDKSEAIVNSAANEAGSSQVLFIPSIMNLEGTRLGTSPKQTKEISSQFVESKWYSSPFSLFWHF